jgi:hypothetical protein
VAAIVCPRALPSRHHQSARATGRFISLSDLQLSG